ncbi:MAG: hypothetical protein AAF989_09395, partial [Planctomycetota bacterium]
YSNNPLDHLLYKTRLDGDDSGANQSESSTVRKLSVAARHRDPTFQLSLDPNPKSRGNQILPGFGVSRPVIVGYLL